MIVTPGVSSPAMSSRTHHWLLKYSLHSIATITFEALTWARKYACRGARKPPGVAGGIGSGPRPPSVLAQVRASW